MGISRDIPSQEPEAAPDFQLLYERLRLPVYRLIRSVVLDGPVAEQLTQQTFERAHERHRRWNRAGSPTDSPTWVYGIAAEVVLAYMRRQRWARLSPSRLLQPGSATAAIESASAAERALAALAPEARLLVVLALYVQLSDDEIGEVMSTPRERLTVRLERAFRVMREALEMTDHGGARERLKG